MLFLPSPHLYMSTTQRALSAMLWDFIGKAGIVVVRFLESILLVRFLGNNDFGALSILLNFQASAVFLASLGIDGVLSRFIPELQIKQSSITIQALLGWALHWRLLTLLILGLGGFFGAESLVSLLFEQKPVALVDLVLYLKIIAFLIFSIGLQEFFRRLLVIHYRQRLINAVELGTFILYLGGALLWIHYGGGIEAVLWTNLISKVISFLVFFLKSRESLRGLWLKWPRLPIEVKERIYPYAFNFYLYSIMTQILGKISDIYLLGKFGGDLAQVAFYTIAYNFTFFSVSFFEMALQGGFILPFITEVYQKGQPEGLRKIYNGLFEFIYLFTLPISLGGFVLAKDLTLLFFGQENLPAAILMMGFFVHFAVVKIGALNASFMLAADQQARLIRSRVFFGGLNIVLNLWLVRHYQALGVLAGTFGVGVISSVYESWCVHGLIQPRYPWRFFLKVLGASGLMALVVAWILPWLSEILWLKVMIAIGLGALIYLSLLVILKPVSPEHLELLQKTRFPLRYQLQRWFAR